MRTDHSPPHPASDVLTRIAGVCGSTAWRLDQGGVSFDEASEDRISFGETHRHIIIACGS